MNARNDALSFLYFLFIVVLAAACQPVVGPEPEATLGPTAPADTASEPPTQQLSIPGAEPDTETPAGVVEAFYTWYLDPDRSGDFSESPYLSQRQVEVVAQATQGGRFGADPFLLAQDTPATIRVEAVAADATAAQVVLHQYWSVDAAEGEPYDLTLDLIREDGGWKIDRIQKGSPLTPHGVVQLFYNWYFAYADYDRTLGSVSYALGPAGNPLADRAYRDSPYLAPAFVTQVDALLAEIEASSTEVAYDPFLRARNHPQGFFILTHEMWSDGNEAGVPVQLIFGRELTVIDVIVVRENGSWHIVDVEGEPPDPATSAKQVVALFSGHYFSRWYAYADEFDQPHTGQVDLAAFLAQTGDFYRDSPFLSPTFAAAAPESVAAGSATTDPFFLAEGIPAMLEVEEAWADGHRAEVRVVQRWVEGNEIRPLTVKLVREEGRWLVDGVVPLSGEAAAPADPRTEMHPADVVRAFFTRYLAQGGYAGGAHRDNDYLTPACVEVLENDLSYFATLGIPVEQVDPLLHTATAALADLRVELDSVTVDEERNLALARVQRIFDNGVSLPLTVLLTRDWDNRWAIQEVHAVDLGSTLSEGEDLPDEYWLQTQIAALYDWAIPYREQPEKVNELPGLLRFTMEAEGGLTFCTSSWPHGFVVESAFIEPDAPQGARRAAVVLRTTGVHSLLTLELEQREWMWVIIDQHCGDTPAGRAHAFYTAYLGYHGDPMGERAYARGDYLTADLIMAVDGKLEAASPGMPEGGDPFTLTETTPQWFHVRPGDTANSALVTLAFQDGTTHELRLTFVLVDGRWLLSSVDPAA